MIKRHKWSRDTQFDLTRRCAVCGLVETYRKRALPDRFGRTGQSTYDPVYRDTDGREHVNPDRVPPCNGGER